MSSDNPKILVVGTVDLVKPGGLRGRFPAASRGPEALVKKGFELGGPAIDTIRAFRDLDQVFKTKTDVELLTSSAKPPEKSDIAVSALLEHEGIGFENIPLLSPLMREYNESDLDQAADDLIRRKALDADLVLIYPDEPLIGRIAAKAAFEGEKDIPVITSWRETQWPENGVLGNQYETMLLNTDVLLTRPDAVLESLREHNNADDLLTELHGSYTMPCVLMAHDGGPARAFIEGVLDPATEGYESFHHGEDIQNKATMRGAGNGFEYIIPVNSADKSPSELLHPLRNAAVAHRISQGQPPLRAFEIGTRLATLKAQHPGMPWSGALLDAIQNDKTLPTPKRECSAEFSGINGG